MDAFGRIAVDELVCSIGGFEMIPTTTCSGARAVVAAEIRERIAHHRQQIWRSNFCNLF